MLGFVGYTGADLSVVAATLLFFVLSAVLSVYLTRNYLATKKKNYLYWSAGMWIFALTDLSEVLFAFGTSNPFLFQLYLFLVAFLVIPLAMGSLELIKSRLIKNSYIMYSIVTTVLLVYYTFTSDPGAIVTNHIVNGNAPTNVLIVSSLITFPALIIIVAIAVQSYLKTKRKKALWIILGMLTFAFGGILYIASFPELIYYTEFAGLVMLWLGFFDFSVLKKR